MITYSGNIPTGERLLSTLLKLYADQTGTVITYQIGDKEYNTKEQVQCQKKH